MNRRKEEKAESNGPSTCCQYACFQCMHVHVFLLEVLSLHQTKLHPRFHRLSSQTMKFTFYWKCTSFTFKVVIAQIFSLGNEISSGVVQKLPGQALSNIYTYIPKRGIVYSSRQREMLHY